MTKRKELTKKEEEFWYRYLDYYFYHLKEPTRDELASYLKMSSQLCQYYVSILKKKGYIKKVGKRIKISK